MNTKQRQNLLQYLGYYSGIPDGMYGPQTKQAVEDFQKDFGGIGVDGVAGQETDKALRHAVAYGMPEDVVASWEQPVVAENATTTSADWWKDIRYFTRAEFRCTCPRCGGFPVEPKETMVRVVDEIRHRAGVPIFIVDSGGSGIRCKEHNAEVGGVPNSEHLYGCAADLHSQLPPAELYRIADGVTAELIPGRGGIGLYRWGIHVDVGKYSRWNG